MRILLFGIIAIVLFSANKICAQPESDMPSEPGKCYAKCLAQFKYEMIKEKFNVYTGDIAQEIIELETKEVVIFPEQTEWMSNASSKPELVSFPAEIDTLIILKDTTQSEQYEVVEIEREVRIPGSGVYVWCEVVCADAVTKDFVSNVQEKLKSKGYYSGKLSNRMGPSTKSALLNFQKDNNLPRGQLDIETLAALGVDLD